MKDIVSTIAKGFAVGAGMSIPGISGGTTAMLLGIYDRLVCSVSRMFSEPRERVPFLLWFALGGAAGVFLAAGIVAALLDSPAGLPLKFAFLGAAAGGIPIIFRKADLRRLKPLGALEIALGAGAALGIGLLPEGLFAVGGGGICEVLLQLLAGVLTAAALVLPGISASHIMYVLGIYESAAQRLACGDILPLVPLAVGVALGTFLTARVLERLLTKHNRGCLLVILGFMTASLWELLPRNADGVQTAIGAVCAAVTFLAVRWLSSHGDRTAEGAS